MNLSPATDAIGPQSILHYLSNDVIDKASCVRPKYLLKFQLCPDQITNPNITCVLPCPSIAKFHDLHRALQIAFSWASTHSFDFRVLDPDYEEPDDFSIEAIQARLMSGPSASSPRENLLRILEKDTSGRMALFQVDRMHENARKHPRTAEKDAHKTKLWQIFDNQEYKDKELVYSYDWGDYWIIIAQ